MDDVQGKSLTDIYDMTDNTGEYIFQNVTYADLIVGKTYSISETAHTFYLSNRTLSGSWSVCNPAPTTSTTTTTTTACSPDMKGGYDISGFTFSQNGDSLTVVVMIDEISGCAPTTNQALRIFKVSGYNIIALTSSSVSFTGTAGPVTYNIDNSNWSLTTNNISYFEYTRNSLIPALGSVTYSYIITRATPNAGSFSQTVQVRPTAGETNFANNTVTIPYAALVGPTTTTTTSTTTSTTTAAPTTTTTTTTSTTTTTTTVAVNTTTRLLLHLDEGNGATYTVDSSIYNVPMTMQGGASLQNSYYKFGSSAYLTTTGQSIVAASASPATSLAKSSWMMDFWFRVNATGEITSSIINNTEAGNHCEIFLFAGGPTMMFLNRNSGLEAFSVEQPAWVANQWYHIAYGRNYGAGVDRQDDWLVFIDGQRKTTSLIGGWGTDWDCSIPGQPRWTLGPVYSPIWSGFGGGYIDEFRFVYGTVSWTNNFTPPNAPY